MSQTLRVLTGFAEGLGLVLSTHRMQLINTCNSNLRGFNTLVPLGTCTHVVYINSHRHPNIQINTYFVVLGMEPRTLFMLSKTKTTELHCQSYHSM